MDDIANLNTKQDVINFFNIVSSSLTLEELTIPSTKQIIELSNNITATSSLIPTSVQQTPTIVEEEEEDQPLYPANFFTDEEDDVIDEETDSDETQIVDQLIMLSIFSLSLYIYSKPVTLTLTVYIQYIQYQYSV